MLNANKIFRKEMIKCALCMEPEDAIVPGRKRV